MKYYLIAGEASGDLHASQLMKSLKDVDSEAEFRFFGGDMMSAVGGERVRHYSELAYMGFIPVLLHLPKILSNMSLCKRDIVKWNPDAVILIDYPGFNLSVAGFVHSATRIPVYYYISPKIWAWKEWRIKSIKRDVDEMFSILPFEIPFYENKHNYPIHYVGNPTYDEINTFLDGYRETKADFCRRNGLSSQPIIALLPGSRRQEIKDNLPAMIAASMRFSDYQVVVACSPGLSADVYEAYSGNARLSFVTSQTYQLLFHASAALVTSGTATLETALLGVPQVVCYETPLPKLISFLRRHLIKVRYVSLVNLIADAPVVTELVADTFGESNIADELSKILPDGIGRRSMLQGYDDVRRRLGTKVAPVCASEIIYSLLTKGSR